jgi:protein-disulfide isomerase
MKIGHILTIAAALLASTACNNDKSNSAPTTSAGETIKVDPPQDGDWSKIVNQTAAGGYLMGNPQAPAKLIEIGALTCSHCREFDETGVPSLIEKYVKTGKVSWEFRPYLLSGLDVPANLIVRCNGPKAFFPLMRALYEDQPNWLAKVSATAPGRAEQIQSLPPQQQFAELAKLADLQSWAAVRGVPRAKSEQCLKDEAAVAQLVQQTSDVQAQFPKFAGTPSFILNGEMLEISATWPSLEPELKKALQ